MLAPPWAPAPPVNPARTSGRSRYQLSTCIIRYIKCRAPGRTVMSQYGPTWTEGPAQAIGPVGSGGPAGRIGHPALPWSSGTSRPPAQQAAPGIRRDSLGAFFVAGATLVADSPKTSQRLLKRVLSHFAYGESLAVRTRICCVVGGRPDSPKGPPIAACC
jgi:hypothetical protein